MQLIEANGLISRDEIPNFEENGLIEEESKEEVIVIEEVENKSRNDYVEVTEEMEYKSRNEEADSNL